MNECMYVNFIVSLTDLLRIDHSLRSLYVSMFSTYLGGGTYLCSLPSRAKYL